MSDSPAELEFWQALLRAQQGLPGLPVWDKYLVKTDFGTRRPDFAWPGLKLAVEINGQAYHSRHADFNKDHRRRRALQRAGWVLVEFTASEVLASADGCVIELFTTVGWSYPDTLEEGCGFSVKNVKLGGAVRAERVAESSSSLKVRRLG